jgi:soluble epoxide hydrolase / lipid-phosphate phosphatase
METLTKKTLKVSRGYIYNYYAHGAAPSKPTLLFFHGFPDHAEVWFGLATNYLIPSGYGVVIPDLLGYGGTSKPTDPAEYVLSGTAQDVADILDAEDVAHVISVGHDWGSSAAQRFYVFQPERCIGLITLNIAWNGKPQGPMHLDTIRPLFEKRLGYFVFWYWYLFADPIEGPKILEDHIESLYEACHAKDSMSWKTKTLAVENGLRDWCLEDKRCEVKAYADQEHRERFISCFKRDGLTGPLCWYRSAVEGHHFKAEKDLPQERYVVEKPYLFIAGLQDPVCLPSAIEIPKKQGVLKDLKVVSIDAGHWCMLEKPEEVGQAVVEWLELKYGGGLKL